ncbi:MAG: hypothetical protein JXM79_01530 [Sedimentisphaerales bacterium]|nr:hypothetical protein [Sedimentisphaerales bacterium]
MNDLQLRNKMISRGLTVKEGPPEDRLAALKQALAWALPPKSVSDRTCHRKVIDWLAAKFASQVFNPDEILPRVIDYALEASGPSVRNPNALFMSLLKKELGYPH